jgi:hypothetical protein
LTFSKEVQRHVEEQVKDAGAVLKEPKFHAAGAKSEHVPEHESREADREVTGTCA